jgi:hypothetical protein
MADNTSKNTCVKNKENIYGTVKVQESNSYTVNGCRKRNTHRINTRKIVNNRKIHSKLKSTENNKSDKERKYNNNKKREITVNGKEIYEYSKDTQKRIISKKNNRYRRSNIQKPVINVTSTKYSNNNNSCTIKQVNIEVLCTRCRSTSIGAYTCHLREKAAERGGTSAVKAKRAKKCVVYSIMASRKKANTQKYSISDITEMAENNGPMDVDPDGKDTRVSGPAGKFTVSISTGVQYRCKKLVRGNPIVIVIRGYKTSISIKVYINHKMHVTVRIAVGNGNMYKEPVVINVRSVRKKTVPIQSSSWHKEYGE